VSALPVALVKYVDPRVLGKAVELIEKHRKKLHMDARRLADLLAEAVKKLVDESGGELDRATYLRMALTVLAAVRMYMYILAEAAYKRIEQSTPEAPGKKLAYVKTVNEALEVAWHLSVMVLECPECGEEEKPLYM